MPIVRTFVPFVAGVGGDVVSGVCALQRRGRAWSGWASASGAGYVFGNVPIVKENFSLVAIGIVIVSVLPMVIEYLKYRREGRAS